MGVDQIIVVLSHTAGVEVLHRPILVVIMLLQKFKKEAENGINGQDRKTEI